MGKRFSLREFQQKIIDRIQQKEIAGSQATTLGIQLGKDRWLVDMQEISEVLPLPETTPVHLTQSWYKGVANVRGNLYSIVDLPAFMGHEETPDDGHCRILLANQKYTCNAGFLVTRVLGLRDSTGWKQDVAEGEVHYQDEQGNAWRKLDVSQLLMQPDFLQIGI